MKVLQIGLTVASILLILWVGVSYVDIVADNCSGNPVHADWNAFVLLTGGLK